MKRHGYTLIETMLAIMIIMTTTLLMVPMMKTIQTMYYHPRQSDDLNMIHQLRMDLCIQNHVSVTGMQLYDDEGYYEYHQHRLVKRPGYVIYLQDIDSASFYESHGHIYLRYVRNQQDYEVYLCEKT